jgi:hypothetical protein
MAFVPKDAINAAKEVAAHAVGKSTEMVEGAGKVIASPPAISPLR